MTLNTAARSSTLHTRRRERSGLSFRMTGTLPAGGSTVTATSVAIVPSVILHRLTQSSGMAA